MHGRCSLLPARCLRSIGCKSAPSCFCLCYRDQMRRARLNRAEAAAAEAVAATGTCREAATASVAAEAEAAWLRTGVKHLDRQACYWLSDAIGAAVWLVLCRCPALR